MPYKFPDELKEISRKLGAEGDATLEVADKTGGGVDEDKVNVQYTPIAIGDDIYVRKNESTFDWKNYRLEIDFNDGTHQEFLFTAPDEGAAKKAIADRKALFHSQDGSYKLTELPTPKELEKGSLQDEGKVVEESKETQGEKSNKRTAKAQKEAEKADEAPKADKAAANADKADKAEAKKAADKKARSRADTSEK